MAKVGIAARTGVSPGSFRGEVSLAICPPFRRIESQELAHDAPARGPYGAGSALTLATTASRRCLGGREPHP